MSARSQYSSTELNYWAIVFQEVYSETITAETSGCDGEIKKF